MGAASRNNTPARAMSGMGDKYHVTRIPCHPNSNGVQEELGVILREIGVEDGAGILGIFKAGDVHNGFG